MASKEVMLAFLGSSRWRPAALASMAALLFSVCAAAQENSSPAPTAGSADHAAISADQTLARVRELRAAGRLAAALEPLEQHLASDPRNTVVRLEYARTLAILRRFPEAAREYRRVLEAGPQNAAALIGMAKVASWQGQDQLALETYDRVLAQRPMLYDAVVGKAFVLLWMGRQGEARALFRKSQRQHPNDHEVREALASLGSPAADAAGETVKPAVSDAKKPAASDAPGSAPAEMLNPAPAEAARPAPPATAASPTAVFELSSTAPTTTEGKPVIPAGEAATPQPVPQQPQRNTAPSRASRAHQGTAASSALVQRGPLPAPNGSPLQLRISSAILAQLAMLGMVAAIVGAIAYRRYRVRQHAAPLPTRRIFELPPSALAPSPRPALAGKEGLLAGRVLVVHPQEAVRDFARKVLAGAGAEVLVLGRGEDAVVRLEKWPYDAIVVSDQLPAGWSGREIYRWLERNHPGVERRFVLALTDETDPEMQAFLEESRALAIWAPFGVSDLLAMTRLAMGRSRAQA